jgi:putative pyruvate formate lyase activating enzyme
MSVRILHSGIHFGEEGVVWGNDRSGMVVFSGCHLSCSFCYTPEASQLNLGENFTAEEFKNLLAKLLAEGARNINLISPTHTWSVIESVLEKFKEGAGKKIPLLLKFSGFESPALIRRFARLGQ